MSISPLLSSTYLQPLVNPAINAASFAIGTTAGTGLGLLSLGAGPQDSGSLSPFTQLLSTLQRLQQSNPASILRWRSRSLRTCNAPSRQLLLMATQPRRTS